ARMSRTYRRYRGRAAPSFVAGALALGPIACTAEVAPSPPETVREAISPTYTSVNGFIDATGTIHTKIYQCQWQGPAEQVHAECPVEPNYVLIGGGAEIEGESPLIINGPWAQPGALLTSCYPDTSSNLTTWKADSKDHLYPFSHRLRAYA